MTFSTICRRFCGRLLLLLSLAFVGVSMARTQEFSIEGKPLASRGGLGHDGTSAKDVLVAGKPVVRLTGVTTPSIAVFQATNTGRTPAMIVLPGGGYQVLASDLEGTEVANWLNTQGITAVVVHYRVPTNAPHREPLEDALTALAAVRSNANAWHIDATKIGVLGFSAGADLAARLAHALPVTDRLSGLLLVYPAYLSRQPAVDGRCSEQVRDDAVPAGTATPLFAVQAEDDAVGVCNSVDIAAAWKRAGGAAELHLFAEGGHGYGLRHTAQPVTAWDVLAVRWMHTIGMLPPLP